MTTRKTALAVDDHGADKLDVVLLVVVQGDGYDLPFERSGHHANK